jgi:hypothetical protein
MGEAIAKRHLPELAPFPGSFSFSVFFFCWQMACAFAKVLQLGARINERLPFVVPKESEQCMLLFEDLPLWIILFFPVRSDKFLSVMTRMDPTGVWAIAFSYIHGDSRLGCNQERV